MPAADHGNLDVSHGSIVCVDARDASFMHRRMVGRPKPVKRDESGCGVRLESRHEPA